jgi:hypothetical protein
MRHSDPNLTLNTYARARQNRLSEIVSKVEQKVFSGENNAIFMQKQVAVSGDRPRKRSKNSESTDDNEWCEEGDLNSNSDSPLKWINH